MKTKFLGTLLTASFLMSLALPVLAVEGTTTPRIQKNKVDGACMATAVDKRDSAVITGVDTYHTSVATALSTRKDALKAAWLLIDPVARKTALKAAWSSFKGTWKNAAKALKTTRKGAWKQFDTDRKACHGLPSDEPGSEGVDAQI